jgi:hypothetical protein
MDAIHLSACGGMAAQRRQIKARNRGFRPKLFPLKHLSGMRKNMSGLRQRCGELRQNL